MKNLCCCSVTKSYPTLFNPMDCSMPGFPVPHHLLELAQTHEWVMPSNHLILCRSLLLLPSIFPSINLKKVLPPVVSLDLLFDRFEFGKRVPLITVLQTISSGNRIFIETISMNSWGFSLFKNIC